MEAKPLKRQAWVDPDDQETKVDLANTSRLRKFKKTEQYVTATELEQGLRGQYSLIHNANLYSWANHTQDVHPQKLIGTALTRCCSQIQYTSQNYH